jgi:bifunctional DNA-binding transcriptional regulator/antitoxin component of YhaV-PrlF toxin-antitoxin module
MQFGRVQMPRPDPPVRKATAPARPERHRRREAVDPAVQEVAARLTDFVSKVGQGGRLQIPAELRRLLGLEVGQEVLMVRDADGRLIVTNRKAALRYARQLVRRRVPPERSLAAELLADRHSEAKAEASNRT